MMLKIVIIIIIGVALTAGTPTTCPATPTLNETKNSLSAFTGLAIQWYKSASLKYETRNLIISPVSLALTLAILENGADGTTRENLKNHLLKENSNADVLTSYSALQTYLRIEDGDPKLTISNALFFQNNLTLQEEFEKSTKDCFKSKIDPVDFENQLRETRLKIDNWISDKTSDEISDSLNRSGLPSGVRMLVANAINFESQWGKIFKVSDTQLGPFYRFGKDQDPQQVPYMVAGMRNYPYFADNDLQTVEMAYGNENLSMFIFLPRTRNGFEDLERNMTVDRFKMIISSVKRTTVIFKLPKFSIRTSINLKEVLTSLRVMFYGMADFTKINDAGLIVSTVDQQSFINVTEGGSKAGAATSVALWQEWRPLTSYVRIRPFAAGGFFSPNHFIADHPFLYAIVHKPTQAIVFMGKVNYIE